jgi:hypothetical protein
MRMIVIEEANQTFADDKESRYDLGDGPGLGFLRSARKIDGDTSVVMTDQVPSALNRATIANCENVICFALGDYKDIEEAGWAAGLERHLHRELVELGEREVIARLGRYSRRALKIQIDEISFPQPISREEARERSKLVLDSIPFVKRHPKKDGGGKKDGGECTAAGGLPPDELRWFAHFVREPWLLTPDLMKATGLDRDSHDHIRAKFEARGCIAFDGKVGAKFKLWRPTPRGVELANSLGLRTGLPRRGGIGHECMVAYLQSSLGEYLSHDSRKPARLLRVGAAATTQGVQPDLLVARADGGRFACQVCHRNQPAYEADALLKLNELALGGRGDADKVEFVLAVAQQRP